MKKHKKITSSSLHFTYKNFQKGTKIKLVESLNDSIFFLNIKVRN